MDGPVKVRWTAYAREEARAAFLWYGKRNPDAAENFMAALRRTVNGVLEAPARWPVWRYPYRRRLFERFPYMIVYRWSETDGIVFAAVRHQHRNPDADIHEVK